MVVTFLRAAPLMLAIVGVSCGAGPAAPIAPAPSPTVLPTPPVTAEPAEPGTQSGPALDTRDNAARLAEAIAHKKHASDTARSTIAASRRVHLAQRAGTLVGSYPPAPKRRVKRGKRSVKVGHVNLRFPKAGRTYNGPLFDGDGQMMPDKYVRLSRMLSDPGHRVGGEEAWTAIHPRLFTMLYFVGQHFGKPIEVISAYRVPGRSRKTSNHVKGRAIDFKVKGVSRRAVMAYIERSFTRVGVGWYPRSTFIHLDTRGRTYYWVDRSKPGRSQRVRKRKIGRKPRKGTDPTATTVHVRLR